MRLSRGALAILPLLAACATPRPETPLAPAVSTAEHWGVFAEDQGGERMCWVAATPVSFSGEFQQETDAFLMTAVAPERLPHPEVSYVASEPLTPHAIQIEVGEKVYPFFAEAGVAWVQDTLQEPELLSDLRAGRLAVARSVTADGEIVVDRFSLMGFTAALEEAKRLCA